MNTAAIALVALLATAVLFEIRRLRHSIERFSRARIGVVSIAEIVATEDAVNKAWDEFLTAEALRLGEDRLSPEAKAKLAVERYRARHKHDLLLLSLNRARQAEADFRSGRKTFEQIPTEFDPSLKSLMSPQVEERRVYEEALSAARGGATSTV